MSSFLILERSAKPALLYQKEDFYVIRIGIAFSSLTRIARGLQNRNNTIGIPPLDRIDVPILAGGLALFILEPLAILSLSIWGSVSFKTINNGIFVIAVYILGILGSMMEQIGTATRLDGLVQWGIVTSLVSPFDSIYRKMIEVVYSASSVPLLFSSPLFISNTYPSGWMMLYALVFLAGLLVLAIRKFNRKDIM